MRIQYQGYDENDNVVFSKTKGYPQDIDDNKASVELALIVYDFTERTRTKPVATSYEILDRYQQTDAV